MEREINYSDSLFWDCLTAFLCILCSCYQNTFVIMGTIAYISLLSLFRNPLHNVYTLLVIYPFEMVFSISGASISFVIFIAMILKILYKEQYVNRKVLCVLAIILIEIYNSASHVGFGTIVHFSTYMLLFYFSFSNDCLKDWSQKAATLRLYVSYIAFLIAVMTIIEFDGMQSFITQFSGFVSAEERFGVGAELLGGAMGSPIYSAITLAAAIMLLYDDNSAGLKILNYIMIVISVLYGFMSIARFFLIAVVVIVSYVILNPIIHRKKTGYGSILFVFIMIILLASIFADYAIALIEKLSSRTEEIGGDLRFKIWVSVFEFLVKLPNYIALGAGTYYYWMVGWNYGFEFAAHTHNFYLDVLMSWGIVGCLMLWYIIQHFKNKYISFRSSENENVFSSLPIIIILLWFLTAGTASTIKPFIFLGFGMCSYYLGGRKSLVD